MTPRLTLISHAATPALRAAGFPLDEALDPRGLAAAEALRGQIAKPGAVFSSPLLRCRQTAQALGLAATLLDTLRECDYGRWAGRSFDEVAASEPEAISAWLADPEANPHGGESVCDLIRRVGEWLDSISPSGHVIAVTHASVVRAAIVHAIGAEARSFWRIEAGPLSMTDLRHSPRGWTLRVGGS